MEETAGDVGNGNKMDLITPMVNDSYPRIYCCFPLHVGCVIPSRSLQLRVYNSRER